MVLARYSGFPHQYKITPIYIIKCAESVVKHKQSINQNIYSQRFYEKKWLSSTLLLVVLNTINQLKDLSTITNIYYIFVSPKEWFYLDYNLPCVDSFVSSIYVLFWCLIYIYVCGTCIFFYLIFIVHSSIHIPNVVQLMVIKKGEG